MPAMKQTSPKVNNPIPISSKGSQGEKKDEVVLLLSSRLNIGSEEEEGGRLQRIGWGREGKDINLGFL